jgi:hypothetical protein
LSFSLKNSKARQIQIQKIKNHIISYLKLKKNAHNHTFWIQIARKKKIINVIENISKNWIINSDFIFFRIIFREICSICSLFFIIVIHSFRWDNVYRSRIITKTNSINSFHIRNNVQNFPSRQSLNVTKVCKKNWRRSPIINILHNRAIR